MKKILWLIFTAAMIFSLCVPCQGSEFSNSPVTDMGECLTGDEYDDVSERLGNIREKYGFDVAIFTEYSMTGSDAKESAELVYDALGYGDSSGSGLLLYICMGEREFYFTAKGEGTEYFNSNGLRFLDEEITPYLKDDDYYKAFVKYAEKSEELLEMAMDGTPYNKEKTDVKYLAGVIAGSVLIPLIIALVMMLVKLRKMKTAVADNYASNYIKPGSMNLSVSRDLFLFSSITKTKKVNTTASGSSGGDRSGRGGSF